MMVMVLKVMFVKEVVMYLVLLSVDNGDVGSSVCVCVLGSLLVSKNLLIL